MNTNRTVQDMRWYVLHVLPSLHPATQSDAVFPIVTILPIIGVSRYFPFSSIFRENFMEIQGKISWKYLVKFD